MPSALPVIISEGAFSHARHFGQLFNGFVRHGPPLSLLYISLLRRGQLVSVRGFVNGARLDCRRHKKIAACTAKTVSWIFASSSCKNPRIEKSLTNSGEELLHNEDDQAAQCHGYRQGHDPGCEDVSCHAPLDCGFAAGCTCSHY